jgi:hypothetical protein
VQTLGQHQPVAIGEERLHRDDFDDGRHRPAGPGLHGAVAKPRAFQVEGCAHRAAADGEAPIARRLYRSQGADHSGLPDQEDADLMAGGFPFVECAPSLIGRNQRSLKRWLIEVPHGHSLHRID